jgi:hypothetical protein
MPFFQPDRKPHIIHPSGHEVDVQATFNPDGKMRVDFFRVVDDREERFTYQVSKSFLRKDTGSIMTFDCEYVAYGRVNKIVLVFDVMMHRWTVG